MKKYYVFFLLNFMVVGPECVAEDGIKRLTNRILDAQLRAAESKKLAKEAKNEEDKVWHQKEADSQSENAERMRSILRFATKE